MPSAKAEIEKISKERTLTPADMLLFAGVPKKTISKINKEFGDIPTSVADALIFFLDKGRELGIFQILKNLKQKVALC